MLGWFTKKKHQSYVPPEMPSFPVNYQGVIQALAPYYQQQNPLAFFFEMYVVDVLNKLPKDTIAALAEFSSKHPALFAGYGGDWRQFVAQESHLSDTIDVAIWDLWIRNSKTAKQDGWDAHPWFYAQLFSQNYLADESRVDVWEGNALKEAKQRIEEFRKSS
jgi:hypothetical protein